MAFKLAIAQKYQQIVDVTLQCGTVYKLDFYFNRIGKDEHMGLFARAQVNEIGDDDICRRLVCGWHSMPLLEGDVAFSPEALDAVLNILPVSAKILEAYLMGAAGARQKN